MSDEIAVGDEHFYVLDSNDDVTKLIPKYNINPETLEQDASYNTSGMTIRYESDVDQLEAYISDYGDYLYDEGLDFDDIRLLGMEEDLGKLNYTLSSGGFWYESNEVPEWLKATSFYISGGQSHDTINVGGNWFQNYMNTAGNIAWLNFDYNQAFGIRPVIEIDSSYITSESTHSIPDTIANGQATIELDDNKVIIRISPEDGYELDEILATTDSGQQLTITKIDDSTYSYSAVEENVSVSVSFKTIQNSSTDTETDTSAGAGTDTSTDTNTNTNTDATDQADTQNPNTSDKSIFAFLSLLLSCSSLTALAWRAKSRR